MAYVLQIGSKDIFNDLKNRFGIIQNKSLVIKLPKVPKEFLGDFIRGYFDGDGCVHFAKYWRKDRNQWKWQFTTSFTSGSKDFLIGLHSVLKNFVFGGRLGKKKRGYELVFSQHDSIALFRLMYHNISSNLFLDRKYNTFKKAFAILKINAGVV